MKNTAPKVKPHKTRQTISILSILGFIVIGLVGVVNVVIENGIFKASGQGAGIELLLSILEAVILVLVFCLLAAKSGTKSASNLNTSIDKIAAAAHTIAKGNFNVDFSVPSDDGAYELTESLKEIIRTVKSVENEIALLSQQTAQGRFTDQADSNLYSGEYRKMVANVNGIVNSVKVPLDTISAFSGRLADGAEQGSLENTYSGSFAVLAENLNSAWRSITVLHGETSKLAKAGLEGDLDLRGDESQLSGAYTQIMQNVNHTFDTFKEPLDVASEFARNLANGAQDEPMNNIYKGYHGEFIGNLNSVWDSLLVMLTESGRLAQEGQKGNLAARSDASKVPGHFADVIDGMNGILEAIARPLHEAGNVLEKMAVNDYTVPMSEDYNGEFGSLAKNINGVHQNMLSIEKILQEIGDGDLTSLGQLKETGKLSENDRIMPVMTFMMQTLQNLIDVTDNFAVVVAKGDLRVREDLTVEFKGSYSQICNGMHRAMKSLVAPINEATDVLQSFAQGNLTVEMTGEYEGTYNHIKDSLNQTLSAFNSLLSQINIAANEVSAGSRQISNASQSLSQGTTEQATSIEELTASISQIAEQTKQNAGNALQASKLSETAQAEAVQGSTKMAEMLNSMHDIDESSSNISKIIKVIDDIAFQTNILALNAAVEAARAGQYGKGFAVVAEEVRNLAAKSAEAAKDTTALIESSIHKVETGTKIANETAEMLKQISKSVNKTTALVGNIAAASNEQATSITQIDQGVAQVSNVIQTNSATAEESAASSEELSGQADTLLQMVSRFKLKDA